MLSKVTFNVVKGDVYRWLWFIVCVWGFSFRRRRGTTAYAFFYYAVWMLCWRGFGNANTCYVWEFAAVGVGVVVCFLLMIEGAGSVSVLCVIDLPVVQLMITSFVG